MHGHSRRHSAFTVNMSLYSPLWFSSGWACQFPQTPPWCRCWDCWSIGTSPVSVAWPCVASAVSYMQSENILGPFLPPQWHFAQVAREPFCSKLESLTTHYVLRPLHMHEVLTCICPPLRPSCMWSWRMREVSLLHCWHGLCVGRASAAVPGTCDQYDSPAHSNIIHTFTKQLANLCSLDKVIPFKYSHPNPTGNLACSRDNLPSTHGIV